MRSFKFKPLRTKELFIFTHALGIILHRNNHWNDAALNNCSSGQNKLIIPFLCLEH